MKTGSLDIIRRRYDDGVIIHSSEVMSEEARIATSFIEKWGMVAAIEAGEDSAGRARVRLSTPEEVVDRAITMAALLFDRCRTRGWLLPMPSWDQLGDEARRRDNER